MGVQLPDFASVGFVNPQPATSLPVYPQNDAAAEGEAALGKGIEKAGGTVEDVAAYRQMDRNRMDRAMADANFTGQIIPLTEQLKTETDPAKLTALRGQFQTALETAGQAIGDPAARALWTAQQQKHVATGQAEADLRNTQVYRDRYKAGIQDQLSSLTRAGSTATDPTAFDLAKDNIGHLTQSAQDAGAMTAVEGEAYGKAAMKQLIEGRALNLISQGHPDAATALLDQNAADIDPITMEAMRARAESKGSALRIGGAASRALGIAVPAPNSPGDAGTGDITDRIVGAESGGQNVKNPLSSASGPGQFLDSTWLSLIKSEMPDVAAGKGDAQLLALKGDPIVSRKMTAIYTGQNKAALASQGLPTDDGALYLAHFLGAGGAADVLQATPDTPMRQLVSAAVLQANPQLVNMTAGDLRQMTAQRVGATVPATAAPAPPNRTGLPTLADVWKNIQADPSLRNEQEKLLAFNHAKTFYDAQEADAARSERIAAGQQKQALEARTNQIWADVYSGQPKITAQQIATDPAFNGNPERRKAMIELINNPPGSGIPAPQSYAAAQSLVDRIRLPYGDPDKITAPDQVYANIRSLNRPDLEFVLKTLDNSVSPGREKFNAREKAFLDGVKPQIDKSGIMPGLPNDGIGRQKFYEFQNTIDRKIDQYIKDGKDPGDLLDPAKPDYMGKPDALTPYKRTLTQALSDFQNEMGGEQSAASPAPQSIEITATGPNGEKAALRNGQWVDGVTGKPIVQQPTAPLR